MDRELNGLSDLINSIAIPSLVWAFGLLIILGVLLSYGRRLDQAMKLERIGIPIALVCGLLALLIGPYGIVPILPVSVTQIWVQLPVPLLTLVFATLLLGNPLPNGNGLVKPVAFQALFGLFLGFGQYLVGGIAVLFFLTPLLGVDPLMGCLIEVGFEGGHGAASVMGESFMKLGFSRGLDLGLAMATVGLLSSTIIGSLIVVVARLLGWLSPQLPISKEEKENEFGLIGLVDQIKSLAVNLALAGIAVVVGLILLYLLKLISPLMGVYFQDIIEVFPVFPMALLGSFVIRFILEKTKKTHIVSQLFQREIGILATDLLITTAMASLNLPLLLIDWFPIVVLSVIGLVWNLFGMFVFGRLLIRDEWFERSIAEFGNSTGVAASGLLLLRLADPTNVTKTLPVFSFKQLFLQPILSGGLITVIAPIIIVQIGLQGWTEICGGLTLFFAFLALIIPRTDLVRDKSIVE